MLSDGILASYLLAFDLAQTENRTKIANFADGDQDPMVDKIGTDDLKTQLRFDVPPDAAIDYFKRKKIVTKKEFDKLTRQSKAGAFYVGGVYQKDVLDGFHQEITDALESGQTQKYVTDNFKEILKGAKHKELGDFHLETVARTNLATAYSVGRRRAMEDAAEDLPFWEYVAVNDDRTRPTHRALDGTIRPANHEFWNTHYPPLGWNCRCTVVATNSYPAGFDKAKPNGDTTLIYDRQGIPVKAEWRNQVLDLQAEQFGGIPKMSELDDVFKSAAQQIESTRVLNHQKVPQAVVDKAKEIRRSEVENLVGWDKDGNSVGHFKGNKDEVYYPEEVESKLDGGFDLHNHPPENGQYFEAPSDYDFQAMVELNLQTRYVVTRNYLYQVRAPKSGWKTGAIDDFYKSYEKNRAKIASELSSRFRTQSLTQAEVDDLERHLIWKEVAKELKFKYKRIKVLEL